jgi:hypothetical protein
MAGWRDGEVARWRDGGPEDGRGGDGERELGTGSGRSRGLAVTRVESRARLSRAQGARLPHTTHCAAARAHSPTGVFNSLPEERRWRTQPSTLRGFFMSHSRNAFDLAVSQRHFSGDGGAEMGTSSGRSRGLAVTRVESRARLSRARGARLPHTTHCAAARACSPTGVFNSLPEEDAMDSRRYSAVSSCRIRVRPRGESHESVRVVMIAIEPLRISLESREFRKRSARAGIRTVGGARGR